METNFNLGSLKTIQEPLLEYLNNAYDGIKKNIEIIRDEKKIPTNHDYLIIMEKLDKTFNMIGLHSLSIIFNLNKEALNKVAEVTYDTDTHLEILKNVLTIVDNTRVYIKALSTGSNEHSTKFFENYSSLATLIRKDVNVKDLFNPRLELKSNIQSGIRDELRRGIVLNNTNKNNLLENLKVISNRLSTNLNTIVDIVDNNGSFNKEIDKGSYLILCKDIYSKLDIAQKFKLSKSYYIIFGLFKLNMAALNPELNNNFEDFIEKNAQAIKEDLFVINDVISSLLKNLDELEEGTKTGILKVKDNAVKAILFNMVNYIKSEPSLMGLDSYRELSMYFDLDYYAEQLLDTKMNLNSKVEINFSTVDKLFNDLKEDFTLLDTKKRSTPESLSQHIQRLINISNKLSEAILPIKEVHILLSQFCTTFSLIKNGKLKLTELIERELSIALVLVEYGVNNIIKNETESRYKFEFGQQAQIQISRIKAAEIDDKRDLALLPMPKLDTSSQKSDEKKSFAKIFEQVSLELLKMEESLDNILRNNGEGVESISVVLKPLNEMRGIFSIVGKQELSPILYKISEIWLDVQNRGQKNWEITPEMKESIVLISGVSLFVEAVKTENEVEAEEHYENIIKRFDSGIFRNTSVSLEDEKSTVELYNFENNNTSNLMDEQAISVVVELPSAHVFPKTFSLEENLSDANDEIIVEENSFEHYLNKEDVVKEFNNFVGSDVKRIVFLIKNYLFAVGASQDIINSGELLGIALVKISIDQSVTKIIDVKSLKHLVSIDALFKVLKSKVNISNQTKQDIRTYLNSLPGTVENTLSVEGKKIHNTVEKAITEMLNTVAINNVPNFDLNLNNSEKEPEIFINNIAELKVFKEKPNDEELLEFFLEEVFEIVDSLKFSLNKIERNFDDIDELTNIRRYFHTLKGSGRTIGLDYWGEAAWMTEQTLNRVLTGDLELTKEMMSALNYMKNFFEALVARLKENGEITVDLVTVKMMWLPINNKMTYHVDVELPSSMAIPRVELPQVGLPQIELPHVEKEVVEIEELSHLGDTDIIQEAPSLNFELPNIELLSNEDSENLDNVNNKSIEDIAQFNLENVPSPSYHLNDLSLSLENFNNNPEAEDVLDLLDIEKDSVEIISIDEPAKETTLLDLLNTNNNKEFEQENKDSVESILIDGKEVTLYLFNMYKEESVLHISGLKEFVQSNYGDNIVMDSNFMLHTHTLASISKTVNLQKIARIASGLEDIAITALERDILLSGEDMNIIRHAVNNLELFQNFNEDADISFYEKILVKIDELYNKLTERQDDIETSKQGSLYTEVVVDENSNSSDHTNETLHLTKEDDMNSIIHEKVKSEVEKQLSDLLKEKVEDAVKVAVEKLLKENQEQKTNFLKTIEDLSTKNIEDVKNYTKEILNYKEKLDSLEKVNQQIVKKYDDITKSLNVELEELKLKSKGWFSKLFGK